MAKCQNCDKKAPDSEIEYLGDGNYICSHCAKQYLVIFEQKETFQVIVSAQDEIQADELATMKFDNGDYNERGDCHVETVYCELIKKPYAKHKGKSKTTKVLGRYPKRNPGRNRKSTSR